MRRDPCAFLEDVVDAGSAIQDAIEGISLEAYGESRLIRSSVEREFIIVGEALTQLARIDQALFTEIELASEIISFGNKLTHEYAKVNNAVVWGVIETELPPLIQRCRQLLAQREQEQA